MRSLVDPVARLVAIFFDKRNASSMDFDGNEDLHRWMILSIHEIRRPNHGFFTMGRVTGFTSVYLCPCFHSYLSTHPAQNSYEALNHLGSTVPHCLRRIPFVAQEFVVVCNGTCRNYREAALYQRYSFKSRVNTIVCTYAPSRLQGICYTYITLMIVHTT